MTVIEIVSNVSYIVRYPDGTTEELLVDSEYASAARAVLAA